MTSKEIIIEIRDRNGKLRFFFLRLLAKINEKRAAEIYARRVFYKVGSKWRSLGND